MNTLKEPFLNSNGEVNTACIDEIIALLKNSPDIYEKFKNNIRWNRKHLLAIKDITSSFAKWAVAQSPYTYPTDLEIVIKILEEDFKQEYSSFYREISLNEVSQYLYTFLFKIPQVLEWNKTKIGDYDYINIEALIRNVCNDILRDCEILNTKEDS